MCCKLNFNIVENPEFEFEDIIPEFVKQYTDLNIRCDDIRRYFNLNINEFEKIRKECINRGLCSVRSMGHYVDKPKYYYYCERYDTYVITKQINGKKKYFYSCKTEDEAKLLRDELIKVNWCKDMVDRDELVKNNL